MKLLRMMIKFLSKFSKFGKKKEPVYTADSLFPVPGKCSLCDVRSGQPGVTLHVMKNEKRKTYLCTKCIEKYNLKKMFDEKKVAYLQEQKGKSEIGETIKILWTVFKILLTVINMKIKEYLFRKTIKPRLRREVIKRHLGR